MPNRFLQFNKTYVAVFILNLDFHTIYNYEVKNKDNFQNQQNTQISYKYFLFFKLFQ